MLSVIPPLAVNAIKALLRTCRWEVQGENHWRDAFTGNGPVIIAIWHESMAMGAHYFRKHRFCTMASHSFDGEMGARIARGFGHSAVRGSSSNGGSAAIKGLSEILERGGTVGFTLDGPRGPRRVAKPGIAILSARTRVPVIPIAFSARPARHLKSWDKLPVPLPFARIKVLFGPALAPPPNDSPDQVEEFRRETECALNALHDQI